MALQGTLRDFALPDIIQLISLGKKTGAIEITGGEGEGTGLLYFEGGRVVSATYQHLPPLEAACSFFIFQSGYFRFIEGDLPPAGRQINLSNEMVILEGIKRAEEWKQIRNGLPSLDVVLKLVVEPGGGARDISLRPDEWRVLTMINGRDTIRNIGAKTGFGDMKTAQIVQQLLQSGLIEPAQVTPSTEPLAAPGTAQTGSLINPLPGTGPLRPDTVRPANGNGAAKPYRRVPGTVPLSEESLQQYLGAGAPSGHRRVHRAATHQRIFTALAASDHARRATGPAAQRHAESGAWLAAFPAP